MARIVVASDAPWVRDEIRGVLMGADTEVLEAERGVDVLPVVAREAPDLVILDLQIGNMGAAAVCRDIREEEGAGRLPWRTPVIFLLDRVADVFIARRADADAWLPKPVPSRALRKTVQILVRGEHWTPDAVGLVGTAESPLEIEGSAAEGVGGDSEALRTGSPAPDAPPA